MPVLELTLDLQLLQKHCACGKEVCVISVCNMSVMVKLACLTTVPGL